MSFSLRTRNVGVVALSALALVVAGCPTGAPDADPGPEDGGLPPLIDASSGDGQVSKDGATGDSATPPVPCGRLTTVCKDGEKCDGALDCASKVCRDNLCQTAAPADGAKNGDETDVDCG